jgi:hypothetical protein
MNSKGLLPQLIQVLHALTEAQQLLSHKVRQARLESANTQGGNEYQRPFGVRLTESAGDEQLAAAVE